MRRVDLCPFAWHNWHFWLSFQKGRDAPLFPTVGYLKCSDSATEQIKPVLMSDFLGFPVLPSSGRTPVVLLFCVFGTLDNSLLRLWSQE